MYKYILEDQLKSFKLKILRSDGQAFEDLFCNIMLEFNKDFKKVKSFGMHGDGKNDGFIPSEGRYYQCYGPEDISKRSTQNYAVNKLIKDFDGLFKQWNSICKISDFYYVINDKYKGIPITIFKELKLLKDEFSKIEFKTLDSEGLENIFIDSLTSDQRRKIVGITTVELVIQTKNNINEIKSDITPKHKVWFEIINKMIYEIIKKLEKLRLKNWYYNEEGYILKVSLIKDLENVLKKYEGKEKDFLKFLEEGDKAIYHLWNDFLESEKDIINGLTYNIMYSNDIDIFENTGFDYQSYIDNCISNIIDMFNEVVRINIERFDLEGMKTIEERYGKINKVINYDFDKKNKKLNNLLKNIIELKDIGRVLIFTKHGEKLKLDKEIEEYFENNILEIYNGDKIKKEKLVSFLTFMFESITVDTSERFSPHFQTNHIIFLYKFLDNNKKIEMENLQKRSNIAIYYFEENI